MKTHRNRWLVVLVALALTLACAVEPVGTPVVATNEPTVGIPAVISVPTLLPANTSYTVTVDVLEIRLGPGTSFTSIGYAYREDVLSIDLILIDASLPECQRWGRIVGTSTWVCLERITEIVGYLYDAPYLVPEYDANTYEVCGTPGVVVGNPGGTEVLYILPVGTRVHIRERSSDPIGWDMIRPANWIHYTNLCKV